MLKALDIMTKEVATIRASAKVADAMQQMNQHGVRSLMVMPRHHHDAYGIVTETDIVYKVIAFGKDPAQVRVHEIMSKPCIVINPDLALEYVARLFAATGLEQAPVIRDRLLGLISVSDILKHAAALEQPQEVRLERELQTAIQQAHSICDEHGVRSPECAAAWSEVDALQSELAHQRTERIPKTAFEEYCETFPDAWNADMLDNLCSG